MLKTNFYTYTKQHSKTFSKTFALSILLRTDTRVVIKKIVALRHFKILFKNTQKNKAFQKMS